MKYSACASPSELDVPGYYQLLPRTNWGLGCWCHDSHTVPLPHSGHQNLGILSSYQKRRANSHKRCFCIATDEQSWIKNKTDEFDQKGKEKMDAWPCFLGICIQEWFLCRNFQCTLFCFVFKLLSGDRLCVLIPGDIPGHIWGHDAMAVNLHFLPSTSPTACRHFAANTCLSCPPR